MNHLVITRFGRDAPASFTPSAPAFCRVAVSVRLSLRATTLVLVFSRTMVFSICTSSLVHGLGFLVFFAIAFSSESLRRGGAQFLPFVLMKRLFPSGAIATAVIA